ncbi:MAG: LPS assembly protein LptD [Rickettsiales bacterium]|nr:LPS assembly protein LptD [Rickettsiales bacterium]
MRRFVFLVVFVISFYANGNEKAVIKSNEIHKEGDVIIAVGDVEINNKNLYIQAEEIKYDIKDKIISSDQLVKIRLKSDKNNKIIFSESASVRDDISVAKLDKSTIVLQNGTILRADKTDIDNNIYKMSRATYSMCPTDIFNENLKYEDLNNIKIEPIKIYGESVVFNKEDSVLTAKNSIIWYYGIPIFYSPYLSVDTSRKLKSGFSNIGIERNSNYGYGLYISYNVVENDYIMKFTPKIYQRGNYMLTTNFNNKYVNFNIDIVNDNGKSKGLYGNKKDYTEENDPNFNYKQYRGLIQSVGNYDFKNNWTLNYNAKLTSDKFYTRDYYGNLEEYQESNIKFEYANLQNYENYTYFKYNNIFYQEFDDKLKRQTPNYIPTFSYNIENKNFKLTANSINYITNREIPYSRIGLTPEARYISDTVIGKININATFNVNTYKNKTNYSPQINFEWNKDIIFSDIIFKPILKYSQSEKQSVIMENNEDSEPYILSFNNIFGDNRLVGYDRMEYGKRISYGFESVIFDTLSFGIAQSYSPTLAKQLNDNNLELFGFNKDKDNKLSDYVGFSSFNFNKNIDLYYRFNIDKNTKNITRNELAAYIAYNNFRGRLTYIKEYKNYESLNPITNEQLVYSVNLKLTNKLSLIGNVVHDFSKKEVDKLYKRWNQIIDFEIGLKYNNNCFEWILSFAGKEPLSKDIKGEKSINFNFGLVLF